MYPHREGVLTMVRMFTANEALIPVMRYTGLSNFMHTKQGEPESEKTLADVYEVRQKRGESLIVTSS